MGLTEKERRELSEIAAELLREDPHLARALSRRSGRRRWRRAGIALSSLSMLALLAGALARQPAVCVIAWIGLVCAFIALVAGSNGLAL